MSLAPRYQVTGPRKGEWHVKDTRCEFKAGPYHTEAHAKAMADMLEEAHEKNNREFKGVVATIKKMIMGNEISH